jgi:hypothetical protein
MHLANLRYSFSNCACPAGLPADDAALPADDELTLATLLELPHAAARKATPAEATIAAARSV